MYRLMMIESGGRRYGRRAWRLLGPVPVRSHHLEGLLEPVPCASHHGRRGADPRHRPGAASLGYGHAWWDPSYSWRSAARCDVRAAADARPRRRRGRFIRGVQRRVHRGRAGMPASRAWPRRRTCSACSTATSSRACAARGADDAGLREIVLGPPRAAQRLAGSARSRSCPVARRARRHAPRRHRHANDEDVVWAYLHRFKVDASGRGRRGRRRARARSTRSRASWRASRTRRRTGSWATRPATCAKRGSPAPRPAGSPGVGTRRNCCSRPAPRRSRRRRPTCSRSWRPSSLSDFWD